LRVDEEKASDRPMAQELGCVKKRQKTSRLTLEKQFKKKISVGGRRTVMGTHSS